MGVSVGYRPGATPTGRPHICLERIQKARHVSTGRVDGALGRRPLSIVPSLNIHLKPLDSSGGRALHVQLGVSVVVASIGDLTAQLPLNLKPVDSARFEGT